MDEFSLFNWIASLLARNRWAAALFGITAALWFLGQLEEREADVVRPHLPEFQSRDEEVQFLRRRLAYLLEEEHLDKPMNVVVNEMLDLLSRHQTDIEELKGQGNVQVR